MALCYFCGLPFVSPQAVRGHLKGCQYYKAAKAQNPAKYRNPQRLRGGKVKTFRPQVYFACRICQSSVWEIAGPCASCGNYAWDEYPY